jgi:hypothetical protein
LLVTITFGYFVILVVKASTGSTAIVGTLFVKASTGSTAMVGTLFVKASTGSTAMVGTLFVKASTGSTAMVGTLLVKASTGSTAMVGTLLVKASTGSTAMVGIFWMGSTNTKGFVVPVTGPTVIGLKFYILAQFPPLYKKPSSQIRHFPSIQSTQFFNLHAPSFNS